MRVRLPPHPLCDTIFIFMTKIEVPIWVNESTRNIISQDTGDYSGRCMSFVTFEENITMLGGGKVKSRSISLSSNQEFPGSSILFEVKETNYDQPNSIQQIIIHAVDDPLIEVFYDQEGKLNKKMKFGKQYEKKEEVEAMCRLGHYKITDLPEVIDFDKTVKEFLIQVNAKDFSKPKLILPSKK